MSAFRRVTGDTLAVEGVTLLYGLIMTANGISATVSVYEGQDAGSGELIHTFAVPANDTQLYTFFPALVLPRGLFIDVGNNVSEVTAIVIPGGSR